MTSTKPLKYKHGKHPNSVTNLTKVYLVFIPEDDG